MRQPSTNTGGMNQNTQSAGNNDMFASLGVKPKTTSGTAKKTFNPFEMANAGNQQQQLSFQTNAQSIPQYQSERESPQYSYNPDAHQQQMGFNSMNQQNQPSDEQQTQPAPKKGPAFGRFKKATDQQASTVQSTDQDDTSNRGFTESSEPTINFDTKSEHSENNHEIPVYRKVYSSNNMLSSSP